MKIVKSIHPDGTQTIINKEYTLDQMQRAVGGDIQIVPSTVPGHVLIVNENGLNENLATNHIAKNDYLRFDFRWPGTPLVGVALLAEEEQDD